LGEAERGSCGGLSSNEIKGGGITALALLAKHRKVRGWLARAEIIPLRCFPMLWCSLLVKLRSV